ncbi:L,D-transpeptidase [Hyphomicrobium sp. 1Nfss2.1]
MMRWVVALFMAISAFGFASAKAETSMVVAAANPGAQAPAHSASQVIDVALPAAEEAANGSEEGAALEPPEPTLFARIDLASQTMTVSDKNGEIARWKISSARGGYKTPTGTYTPHYTARMHYSKQYHNSPMPYSVFFNRGVAVHGTNDLRNLGRPASHGCVRSHPKNAKVFYDLVQKHGKQMTRVTVVGQPPYSPAVAERPRRRVAKPKPTFQPFGGLFGYSQPPKKAKKKQYGGSYNTW